jgi:hypothetical protein
MADWIPVITIIRHQLSYKPLMPNIRIVRVRGVVRSTSLVVLWLWWGIDIECGG